MPAARPAPALDQPAGQVVRWLDPHVRMRQARGFEQPGKGKRVLGVPDRGRCRAQQLPSLRQRVQEVGMTLEARAVDERDRRWGQPCCCLQQRLTGEAPIPVNRHSLDGDGRLTGVEIGKSIEDDRNAAGAPARLG
jgi:hypothetical protein